MSNDDNRNNESRRHFLKMATGTVTVAAVAGVAGFFPRDAFAADLPRLDVEDPVATALQYVEDASTSNNPKYKAGSDCANCNFFHGKDDKDWGTCDLFPGKMVHAKGWCLAYTKDLIGCCRIWGMKRPAACRLFHA